MKRGSVSLAAIGLISTLLMAIKLLIQGRILELVLFGIIVVILAHLTKPATQPIEQNVQTGSI